MDHPKDTKNAKATQTSKDTAVGHYHPGDTPDQPVTLTPAAIEHVQHAIDKRGRGLGLRLSVKKSGCSGYGYEVDYVDTPADDDHIFPITESLNVYVDPESFPFVKGTVIDFERRGLNEIFTYRNPNQTGECGCGESFSVDS